MDERCQRTRRQLAAYLDADLSRQERTQVQEHLAGCRACRRELASEQSIVDGLASLPVLPCPDPLARSIEDAVSRAPARPSRVWERRRFTLGWRSLALAAAAVLAGVALLGLPAARQLIPRSGGPSPQEVLAARRQARASLILAARVIDKAERHAFRDLTRRVPLMLSESGNGPQAGAASRP
jgi:anti-sigma factor RsiW